MAGSLEMEQDEREEGELTDEDLEDVSDSSISLVSLMLTGKSPICRKPFRELSLTSVSDECSDDNVSIIEVKPMLCSKVVGRASCRKQCRLKKLDQDEISIKRPRHTHRRYSRTKSTWQKQCSSISSSSSDSEQYPPNKKILRQLRDAVRISSTKKNPHCSLRTRIRRMIEPDSPESKNSNSDDDPELESLRDQALKSKQVTPDSQDPAEKQSTITDEDLIELRLVALQSAVIKKHENRRKRKELADLEKQQEEMCVVNVEVGNIEEKNENLQIEVIDNVEQSSPICTSEFNSDTVVVEENCEEVKVTIEENCVSPTEIKEDKINIVKSAPKIDNVKLKPNIDEDEDILRAILLTSISKKISPPGDAKHNVPSKPLPVDKLVKKNVALKKTIVKKSLRAPIKPVNRLIINVNSDSESNGNVSPPKKKESENGKNNTDLFNRNLSLFLQQARVRSEMDQHSDISKHLPQSQQIEYRRLKRKLQLLTSGIKPLAKARRGDGTDENKRIRLSSFSKKNTSKTKIIISTSQGQNSRNLPVKKAVNNKLDRLQIKGKYEGLSPMMMRVTEARSSRDKAQTHVKRLISELKTAREILNVTHQNYTELIQQLVKAKADIDGRENVLNCSENQVPVKKNSDAPICTSTPNKIAFTEINCELSRIQEQSAVKENVDTSVICPVEKTPEEDLDTPKEIVIKEVSNKEDAKVNKKPSNENQTISKYTSPLEHIQPGSNVYGGDPLMVLCPYDLLGVCRDPDCVYRHCGKQGTE